MNPGDLVQVRRVGSITPKILGVLLEAPKFPLYGNFPMMFKVLHFNGNVVEHVEEHKYLYEVVK